MGYSCISEDQPSVGDRLCWTMIAPQGIVFGVPFLSGEKGLGFGGEKNRNRLLLDRHQSVVLQDDILVSTNC